MQQCTTSSRLLGTSCRHGWLPLLLLRGSAWTSRCAVHVCLTMRVCDGGGWWCGKGVAWRMLWGKLQVVLMPARIRNRRTSHQKTMLQLGKGSTPPRGHTHAIHSCHTALGQCRGRMPSLWHAGELCGQMHVKPPVTFNLFGYPVNVFSLFNLLHVYRLCPPLSSTAVLTCAQPLTRCSCWPASTPQHTPSARRPPAAAAPS